ncbi:MAG: hypothetical protein JJ959_21275, partial [Nisaea sp.]|nr:hypothetical protein [Nisaea sp.]
MAQVENAAALLAPEAEAPTRPLWEMIREEAEDLASREPLMRETLQDQVLSTECNADIVVRILAARLAVARIPFEDLNDLFHEVLGSDEQAMKTVEADLRAVQARDPACRTYLHALLNLKGFQSLQAHRIA